MVTAVLLRDAGWTQVRLAEVLRADDAADARRPNRQTISRWTRRLTPLVLDVLPTPADEEGGDVESVIPESSMPSKPEVVIDSRFIVNRLLVDESDRLVAVVKDRWSDDGSQVVIRCYHAVKKTKCVVSLKFDRGCDIHIAPRC